MSKFNLMIDERDLGAELEREREILAKYERQRMAVELFCFALASLIGFVVGMMV